MTKRDLRDLHVFIVDDNRHMLRLILAMLEGFEITRVEAFTRAKDALEAMRVRSPDIVITDWEMSPMSGMALFREIRSGQIVQRPEVPVVMLTAHSEEQRVLEARDAGISGFLTKPVSARALYDRIVSALGSGGDSASRQTG